MKKLFVVFVVAMMATGCGGNSSQTNKPAAKEQAVKPVEVKPENWVYNEIKDEMTEEVRKTATCTSLNQLEFEFPYQGGSSMFLHLRKNHDKSQEVILEISKGQFMPGLMGTHSVSFKFDDNKKVYSYNYGSANDGSMNVIFPENSLQIIKNLKKAKKVKVQAEYYQAGAKVCEFNVEGLKWK